MRDKLFFKPTPLYKEFVLLDLIEKNPNVTQRYLGQVIGASVSMINTYLDNYEKKGFLEKRYISNKNLEYHITKEGIKRKKLLNIQYIKASHNIYLSAKQNVLSFLTQIINKGFKEIFLYGAGEVAEILLNVVKEDNSLPISILGIIDDNKDKHGSTLLEYPINNSDVLFTEKHDGLLISSYSHIELMYQRLIEKGYDKKRVISFFDL